MSKSNEADKETTLNKTFSKGKASNVGTGPSDDIKAGSGSKAKQPKEHTGKDTEMGGATGGIPGLRDASEGNDNTSRE